MYWSWPVMGLEQCHLPARWGLLYFLPTEVNVASTPTINGSMPGGIATGNVESLAAGLIGAGMAFAVVGVVGWGRGRIRARRGTKDNAGPETARRLE